MFAKMVRLEPELTNFQHAPCTHNKHVGHVWFHCPFTRARPSQHPNLIIELTTPACAARACEMRYQPVSRLKEHVCDHHKRFSSPE
jgi:hypothetical protein